MHTNVAMPSIVLQQLDRFGPNHCEQLTPHEAAAYAHDLATSHYENFTVTSRLLPRRLRPHFAAVYAFCRWADDLGDEVGNTRKSLELLDWWRDELTRCYAGQPRHPVFVAMEPTIRQFDIPSTPFENLIDAFVQDQTVLRYETWDQVVDYCTRSADPVGRLVLYMCGHADAQRQQLSDRTCTALQLVNFWQDIRRDIVERDRIYIPAEVLTTHGLSHEDLVAHVKGEKTCDASPVVRELVERTWPLFGEGRQLWPLLAGDVRPSVKLFTLGGEAVMRSIEHIDYQTLDQRPSLSKATKLRLMAGAMWGRVIGR
jgi:squalene synthase HpnC